MTKRQQQYEETKQKIWEAGKRLIAQKGYDQVSIADITKASGVSPGNFYHYFKSKDAFFAALEQQPYEELAEELEHLPEGTVGEKLAYYIEKRFHFLGENGPNFTRQWIRHASEPAYHELYQDDSKIDTDIRMVELLLRKAVEKNELRAETPAASLARLIVLSLFGTTFYYSVRDGQLNLPAWGKELSGLIDTVILKEFSS